MNGIKSSTDCKVFQDAMGSLIIEYKGTRVIDERETPC
jgi:hypothetical protein